MPVGLPYAPAEWWQAFVVFGYMTGWRVSEVLALIDWRRPSIMLRRCSGLACAALGGGSLAGAGGRTDPTLFMRCSNRSRTRARRSAFVGCGRELLRAVRSSTGTGGGGGTMGCGVGRTTGFCSCSCCAAR